MRSKNVFLFLEQSKRFLRLRNPMPLRYLTTKPSNFYCWSSDDTLFDPLFAFFSLYCRSSFWDLLRDFSGGKRKDPPVCLLSKQTYVSTDEKPSLPGLVRTFKFRDVAVEHDTMTGIHGTKRTTSRFSRFLFRWLLSFCAICDFVRGVASYLMFYFSLSQTFKCLARRVPFPKPPWRPRLIAIPAVLLGDVIDDVRENKGTMRVVGFGETSAGPRLCNNL